MALCIARSPSVKFLRNYSPSSQSQARLVPKQRLLEGDYVYLLWTAETPDNSYEVASDTFVIRNGRIELQALTAKVTPKH